MPSGEHWDGMRLPSTCPSLRVTVCVSQASHVAAGWLIAPQTRHPPQCTWHLPTNPWDSPTSSLRGAGLLRAEVRGNITTHVAATLKVPSILMEGDDALVGSVLHLPPAHTASWGLTRSQKGAGAELPPLGADRCRAELAREVCPRGAHQTGTGAAGSSIRIDFVVNISQQESETRSEETVMEDVSQPGWLCMGTDPVPPLGHSPRELGMGGDPCAGALPCAGRETEAGGAWPHRSMDQQVLTAPEAGADAESKAGPTG